MVESSFDGTVDAVRKALKAEGFYDLCEIDVQAMLKEKRGANIRKCPILGACNPPLTHRALLAEPDVSAASCNVVVSETDDGVQVNALNVEALVSGFDNVVLADVGHEISVRLQRIVDGLGARLPRGAAAVEPCAARGMLHLSRAGNTLPGYARPRATQEVVMEPVTYGMSRVVADPTRPPSTRSRPRSRPRASGCSARSTCRRPQGEARHRERPVGHPRRS